ncbi:hypothetical protein PPL_10460 [Heterostelium album PN500]|uniref:ATP-grasp domain-containing protein n=1 Tax=Heterostelium pallidum (strain ATCC 26659 / Pp 5 / PN500) TaxID=670386 RepID=D3BR56_HETP5|nr:hypothetical protein PPL_10460 [Heterostelium album PN500]EFA75888.1 hypothetical protein PPL_10460 [Heterostelium album PN500]|eukprot:XP_020428022.1 hypothetical protein PPL_10460 [Heterostelium album PN500]
MTIKSFNTFAKSIHLLSLKTLRIGMVTSKDHPNVAPDDHGMIQQLSKLYECKSVIWDDYSVQWDQFDLLIIRSAWDYVEKIEQFREWLTKIDSMKIPLLNDSNVIYWNWNKLYLLELENQGITIVPSIFVKSCENPISLSDYIQQGFDNGKFETGQKEFVMKPTIGADSYGTHRFTLESACLLESQFRKLLKHSDMIIQPFVDSIHSEGEVSFIFFNKRFSHSIIKHPSPEDFRVQERFGGNVERNTCPAPSDIEAATKVIKYISGKGRVLYSRIDMLRYKGKLCLSECELFEPTLYFMNDEKVIKNFCQAVADQMGESPRFRGVAPESPRQLLSQPDSPRRSSNSSGSAPDSPRRSIIQPDSPRHLPKRIGGSMSRIRCKNSKISAKLRNNNNINDHT